MKLNKEIVDYIEEHIFPIYSKNDDAHNLKHIYYVIERSLKFAKGLKDINYNMVYVVAAYHDIGCHIDRKNHEKVSADILLQDNNLTKWFNYEEIKVMSEAVCDHRASNHNEPRNIYGKIVSTADRTTSVSDILIRTYEYRKSNYKDLTKEEIIDSSYEHIVNKFGNNGYATKKVYFNDSDYQDFLNEILSLVNDKDKFVDYFVRINNIK